MSRGEIIRLRAIEKEIKNLQRNLRMQSGFDYRDWPVITPLARGKDFEITNMHWEYIPPHVHNEYQLKEARKMYTRLNARSETLFVNDRGRLPMFKEGALHGRCLVLSSGFYEWRHIRKIGKRGQPLKATESIPYYVTLKNNPRYFFMAGVSRIWENVDRGQAAETFAIVTTEANDLMQRVHNKKRRMPTILTEELAFEWIQEDLSENRIKEIASFQLPTDQMTAWTLARDFRTSPEPEKEFLYEKLPAL